MNTFFEIANECGWNLIMRLRSAGFPTSEHFDHRQRMITSAQRGNIHRRIMLRGNDEQWKQKFLPNYYGSKRLSRSHVFSANTI